MGKGEGSKGERDGGNAINILLILYRYITTARCANPLYACTAVVSCCVHGDVGHYDARQNGRCFAESGVYVCALPDTPGSRARNGRRGQDGTVVRRVGTYTLTYSSN